MSRILQLLLPGAPLLVALSVGAHAQIAPSGGDPNSFHLPPGEAPAGPPPQGPVDKAHPAVAPTPQPPREPAVPPAPAVRPAPEDVLSPRAVPTRAAAKPKSVAVPAARTVSHGATAATASPVAPAPSPTADANPASPAVQAPPAVGEPQASAPSIPPAQGAQAPFPWLLASGALGLVLLIGALLVLWGQRRRQSVAQPDVQAPPVERPAPRNSQPVAEQAASGQPRPEPQAGETAPVEPAFAPPPPIPKPAFAHPAKLALELVPRQLMLTLMNARMSYRIILSNPGARDAGPFAISGDLISAHASLSTAEQLDFDPSHGLPLHRCNALAAGRSIAFEGDLVLPLSAIRHIRNGEALLFAPLARFCVAGDPANAQEAVTHVFALGEKPPREELRPRLFRLDKGPRTFGQIVSRAIAPELA